MSNLALKSLPSATFVNSPSLSSLDLRYNPDLAGLPADMLLSSASLTTLNLQGSAVSSLPQNVIDTLASVVTLNMPTGLTAWPTGLVLPDTVSTLKIFGNDEFAELPAGVLDQTLPSALNYLRLADLQLSDATLNAIGMHRVATGNWTFMIFDNTGLNGAKLTNLINAWCDDDTGTTPICENYNGPRDVYLFNENLSDWLDPNASQTVLEEQRAAVQKSSCGTTCLRLVLSDNMMSLAQITDLLENIPAGLRILDISKNELNGLRVDFSRFTGLAWLYLTEGGIDTDTADHIINNLPASIQSLRLFSNDIETIPVFPSYPSLSDLWLHRNQLDSLPVGALDGLDLFTLAASYNLLTELPEGLFDDNLRLQTLYLDNNDLTVLPDRFFDNNPALRSVYLNDNELTVLPDELFDVTICLNTVRLHNNDLTELPRGLFAENQCIVELSIYGNEKLDLDIDDFPNLLGLRALVPEPPSQDTTPTPTPTPGPVSLARLLRIEPSIEAVTLSAGKSVVLETIVYGRQDIVDNGLAESVNLTWDDGEAGGSFEGDGHETLYTAPVRPGRYTVSVTVDADQCFGDENQCRAEFKVTVLRPSSIPEEDVAPVNPAGEIPSILTDDNGEQYEVFTPEDGGTFTGDNSSLSARPGVVPNGEIVGLRISEGDAASNAGNTYQRYTLGGSWYAISAVDASGESVSTYALADAAEVCVPLPGELRSNISDVALVAVNSDESLTILSSTVRISAAGTNVCGKISSVPANVAVGSAGAPAPLPTTVPEMEADDLPETGGAAPSSSDALVLTLLIGLAVLTTGFVAMRTRRRRFN